MRPGKKRHYLQQTLGHGGYYVTDCWPWAIKAGCKRLDCPMRTMTLPPEAKETDFLIKCDPPGELADFIILAQRVALPESNK